MIDKVREKVRDKLDYLGINAGIVFAVIAALLAIGGFYLTGIEVPTVLGFAIATSPVWLPLVLFYVFFEWWMRYARLYFNLQQGRTALEILLPEEIMKSPLAMELALGHLWQTASPDNLVQTYWDGKNPPTFGLEIVSLGGTVRFFINTQVRKYKNIIEAQLYSQYPGIEIREVPDYAAEIPHDLSGWEVFSMHFGLRKADAYPIKTYIEYGLDEDPKEEVKIDPITQMLDMMGSVGPNERVWIQILITAHREHRFKFGQLSYKPDWKEEIRKEIDKLTGRDKKGDERPPELRLTEGERRVISALERSMSKIPFNVGIRAIYAAKKDYYLPGERIGAIITSWFQYNDAMLNSFGLRWRTDYDWNWWQDPSGRKRFEHKKRELNEYKRRFYENQAQSDKEFIMTVEELATIYHFPGKVARTPSMPRIPSSRSEAPPNLPTGAL